MIILGDYFINNKSKNTIYSITEQYLCNTCGACAAICPVDCIKFEESVGGYIFPYINFNICTECGLCLEVCPGLHFGQALNNEMPVDPFTGVMKNCFIGKSLDYDIYNNSQSGGIVTSILLNAFKNNFIQAAVVTTMETGDPPRAKAKLATSKKGLIHAQKSKYTPVPVLKILSNIEARNIDVGFVGLPCQVHGLKNYLDIVPELNSNIKFVIGLVCDRTMVATAIDYLINQTKLRTGEKNIIFRDKSATGFPGSVYVVGEDNNEVKPPSVRRKIKDSFTPARCRLCFDKLNIYSDLTIGDPWGIQNADHERGESIVICRTSNGKNLLNRAKENLINLRRIKCESIIKGQRIEENRKDWNGFCQAWRNLGFKLPDYYRKVASFSSAPRNLDYSNKLKRSLALDKHETKDKLLHKIKMIVLWESLVNFILKHYRVAKDIFHEMMERVKKIF